jgi:hypothetical protein
MKNNEPQNGIASSLVIVSSFVILEAGEMELALSGATEYVRAIHPFLSP